MDKITVMVLSSSNDRSIKRSRVSAAQQFNGFRGNNALRNEKCHIIVIMEPLQVVVESQDELRAERCEERNGADGDGLCKIQRRIAVDEAAQRLSCELP